MYFESNRNGLYQLFKATRQSLNDPFGNLEHLSFFDSPYNPRYPALSADGRTFFFAQGTQSNGYDIYYSELRNRPPVACIAEVIQPIEAQGPFGVNVTLDGTCSHDIDSTPGTNDDINDFNWYDVVDPCNPANDILLGTGQIIDCNLPLGPHTIVLEVTDKAGASDSNEITITIQDTIPPDFRLTVMPRILWPPNHQLVRVRPFWLVNDIADPSPTVSLVDVRTSDRGATPDDIVITPGGAIYLRAEHSPNIRNRIYYIRYTACDFSGNCTTRTAMVIVPHDSRPVN